MITIPKDIFRAYDIRGVVSETLTSEVAFILGKALGTQVQSLGEKKLFIARDGRLSGPSLFEALSKGVLSTGCDVVDLGLLPTPLLYFATHVSPISCGIVITGSHNPPNYNGIKMVMQRRALFGEDIEKLYQLTQTQAFQVGNGCLSKQDITESYLAYLKETIRLARPLKIVVDCGNGVSGVVAPKLYEQLGCEVIPLYCEVDGHFPNHHPDPSQPANLKALQQAVRLHQAELGLAFDGDGDRLGVVDSAGNIIWPDRQLILFAKDILTRNVGATIIYDVKCSRHVGMQVEKMGGQPLMWKTGHSFIKAKMQETNALLGGEMSGHIFFKERYFGFDDALYAGARLLEIFSKQTLNSHAFFETLPNSENTPELHIKTKTEAEKFSFVEKLKALAHFEEAKITTIDGLRADFKDGFGLIRPSNTTPSLILRFEGDTKDALERIQSQFRALLLMLNPDGGLPF